MYEAEVIKKLQGLKEIKPNGNWVSLTKTQILGVERPALNPFFIFKPAYAGLIVVFVIFGFLGFAQNSLPGDLLYPIKKITEKSQAVFVSGAEKPNFQLKLANERLEELSKIVKANQVEKLSSALRELAATKNEAKKEVANIIKNKSEEEAVQIAKKIAPELQVIKEKEGEVLASLGLEPEEESDEPTEKTVVEILIKDLEKASLTEGQQELFAEAKEDYQNQNYWGALEKILLLSNHQ